jgi:PAS domain-containing protein
MFGSVFSAVVVVTAGWILWEQGTAAIEVAGTNLQILSQAVADQTDRIIESVGQAEDRLLDHIAFRKADVTEERLDMIGSEQLHGVMRDIIAGMSPAYALVLIDANGDLINFSNEFPIPKLNFADRPYFRFILTHPEVKTFISETVASRQTGRPTFFIVRRLAGPGGVFAGVLMGAVPIAYLERLFGANALPAGGSVTLFRSDGSMLLRHPSVAIEAMQGREAEFRASFFGAGEGPIRRIGAFDGAERLTAMSNLPRHDLRVAISVPITTVIAAWQVEATWTCGIVTLGCLTTALTIFFTIRRFDDPHRLEAATKALRFADERQRAEEKIAEQHSRFGRALDNMSQGLLMFDCSNCRLLANAAYNRFLIFAPARCAPEWRFQKSFKRWVILVICPAAPCHAWHGLSG